MESSLFQLLRIGLEIESPSEDALKRLGVLSFDQWKKLRESVERQGIAAIALDGLNSLVLNFGKDSISPSIASEKWKVFMIQWMGNLLMMEQTN